MKAMVAGGGLPLGCETGCFTNDTLLKGGGLGRRLRVSSTHSQVLRMMHQQKKGVGSYVAVPVEGCTLVGEGFFVAGFVSFGLVIKSSSIKIGSF